MFSKILVGLDGSPGSFQALQAAVELAAKFGGALCALSVIEGTPRYAGTAGEVMETDEAAEDAIAEVQQGADHVAADHDVDLKTLTVPGHAA